MVLRLGDKGDKVLEASELLVEVGLLERPTRLYSQQMKMAVEAWQHHGVREDGKALKVDGVFGPNTLYSLTAAPEDLVFEELPRDFADMMLTNGMYQHEVVNTAIREIEANAREIGGNNKGEFVEKYHRTAAASEHQWAWCAAFTSWCFQTAADKLGIEMPFKYTGGAQAIIKDFRRKGWTYDPEVTTPEAGDVVVWWRGQTRTWKGHVGIVWGCVNDVVYVIEGNVGKYPAHVRIFSYQIGEMNKLIGFGRVPTA